MFKKNLPFLFLLLSGFLLSGCSLKKPLAALQIRSNPTASVFIDGKLLGETPYQASELKPGEISIKLIPKSETESLISWEGKVKVSNGVLTVIERDFGANEGVSSGHILTLEKTKSKNTSLSVVVDPDGALVKLEGDSKGFSPLSLDKINEGDHEIVITKDGFDEKMLNAKAVVGYKLIVNVKLAQTDLGSNTASATPSSEPVPEVTSSKTGKVSPTGVKPSPTGKSSQSIGFILIKENSVGFLRVRNAPSGTEIAQIKPIDPEKKYSLLEEKLGWYKIIYEEEKEGWVSADVKYTEKVTE